MILQYLDRWNSTGAITGAQHAALSALVRKDRFSVFLELNALLYIGVLALAAGAGWTIQTHFARLGDAAILASLTAVFLVSLYYCFSRALPYSNREVEPATFAFDYILYLGCLTLAVELGYLEFRFHFLKENWDQYLLLSSLVYFMLAYRFDNQLVLSLALSTLAGWFGLRVSHFDPFFTPGSLRPYALAYGSVVAMAGAAVHRAGIKTHFLEVYLHIAANVLFVALASGVIARADDWLYMAGLFLLSCIAIAGGLRYSRFAFVVYGVVYAYAGVSSRVLDAIRGDTAALAYLALSGTIVIVSLVVTARRFGREA